ncbi:MAG: MFS transporter [Hyphomonadaceae bacterium]
MTTSSAEAGQSSAPARTPTYTWVVLFMLMFIYIFNFLDRQLMSILIEPIKEEMGFTDSQMGLMTGLYFAIFYTGFGVIAGFLADRTSRKYVLFAGAFLWSLFTMLCGFARNYPTMLAARVGVGVGEAAGAPPSYSMVSDYFPPEKRGLALAIFSLGVPFGQALGAGFGAAIHEAYGWRNAFIGIGVAGIIAAVVMLLVVREPKRGASDVKLDVHMEEAPTQVETRSGFSKTFWDFMSRPALLYTALGCGLCSFVGYAALGWNVSFLIRVKGINYTEVALFYALMLAVAMGLGTWVSGALADLLAKRGKHWYALVPAGAIALSIPFYLAYIFAPNWQLALAALSVPTFLTIMYLPPALAVVQNSLPASQRTMGGALLLMILNIIGLGGGPTTVGLLSDYFATSNGMSSADAIQHAFMWMTPFYFVAVGVLLLQARSLAGETRKNAAIFDGGLRFGGLLTLVGLGGLLARYLTGGAGKLFFNGEKFQNWGGLEFIGQFNAIMDVVQVAILVVFALWGLYLLAGSGKRRTAAA